MLHDEADPLYVLLRDDFNRGIRALKPLGLASTFVDLEHHLPQTIEFVDRHPDQLFIVDHLAKPRVRDREISPWRENLRELARRPNVYCKLSGLGQIEADYSNWTPEQLLPYIEIIYQSVLSCAHHVRLGLAGVSGGDRISAFPQLVASAIQKLFVTEREHIWSGTAIEAYSLGCC